MTKYTKKALKIAFGAGKSDGLYDADNHAEFYIGNCGIYDVYDEFKKAYINGYRFWYEKTLKNKNKKEKINE